MVLDSSRNPEDYFEETLDSIPDFFNSIDYSGSRIIGNFMEETDWEDYWFQEDHERKMPFRSRWEILGFEECAGREIFHELEEEGYIKKIEDGYTVPLEAIDDLWVRLNEPYGGQRSLDSLEKSIREKYNL